MLPVRGSLTLFFPCLQRLFPLLYRTIPPPPLNGLGKSLFHTTFPPNFFICRIRISLPWVFLIFFSSPVGGLLVLCLCPFFFGITFFFPPFFVGLLHFSRCSCLSLYHPLIPNTFFMLLRTSEWFPFSTDITVSAPLVLLPKSGDFPTPPSRDTLHFSFLRPFPQRTPRSSLLKRTPTPCPFPNSF